MNAVAKNANSLNRRRFLLLAGVNALVFEWFYSRKLMALDPHGDPPLAAKAIGAVSLVSWFAVMYFGRMIPYLVTDPVSGV